MYQKRKNKISVKQIASFLNANYTGKDFKITAIGSLNNIRYNSILFYSDLINVKFQIKDNITYDLKKLEKFHDILLITTNEFGKKINVPVILSKNPRLDFQRVAMEFFADDEFKPGIHDTAVVEENAIIGLINKGFIGELAYIDAVQNNGFYDANESPFWRKDIELSGYNIMSLGQIAEGII